MKTFTISDIRSWQPCYDPAKHLPENWVGTALDIVMIDTIPWEDRLWVVMRNELLSDKIMRLFAVWCARQVQHLTQDLRSINAIDVAEAFAKGEATQEELNAARAAAWNAARAAAWNAAWNAARDAAWNAAWNAVRDAAWNAARPAARDAQKDQLVLMILEGEGTGDVK